MCQCVAQAPILIASLATIPVGLMVLNRIDPGTLKILVAAVVMIAAVALYLSPTVRLDRPRLPLSLLVGGLSGVLSSEPHHSHSPDHRWYYTSFLTRKRHSGFGARSSPYFSHQR